MSETLIGDMTAGDAHVNIDFTTDQDMTGLNIYFVFASPSGETFSRQASSVTTYMARYISVLDEFDEHGDWKVSLKDMTNNHEYREVRVIKIRPKLEDMAGG